MTVGSPAYIATLVVTALVAGGMCTASRRRPGRWTVVADWVLGAVLVATSVAWFVTTVTQARFSVATSLPFALCDLAALVAAAALFTRQRLLVEVTYFWGLAGTVQALITPDLDQRFPTAVFFEYVVGHGAIVCAALFLVAGQRLAPRRRAVPRVFAVTLAYSALVGAIDAATGGDYMYLRKPPGEWTLLRVLGPWPWYIASAAGVALVLFTLLDLPWWRGRSRPGAPVQPAEEWRGDARRSALTGPASQTDARTRQAAEPAGQPGVAVRSMSSSKILESQDRQQVSKGHTPGEALMP
ncbi:MAG: TIGR02206 family membrane protein [Acidimicrobiales bacterium]